MTKVLKMLKICKTVYEQNPSDTANMLDIMTAYIESKKITSCEVSNIIAFLTKNKEKSILFKHAHNKDIFELLCKIFEQKTFMSSDVGSVINCMDFVFSKNIDPHDLANNFAFVYKKLLDIGYIFSSYQCKCIFYYGFDNVPVFKEIFNMFIKNMSGSMDDISIVYTYYYNMHKYRCHHSNYDAIYCHTIHNFFMNSRTKITEDMCKSIMLYNLSFFEPKISMLTKIINYRYCAHSEHSTEMLDAQMCNVEIFNKFKNDYYETNNKHYEMTHKMFMLLILNVDLEKISDDVLLYLSNNDKNKSIEFLCAIFETSTKNNDMSIFFSLCDIENSRIDVYNLSKEIIKNVIFVVYLGIINRVNNYKLLFRIFYRMNHAKVYDDDFFYVKKCHSSHDIYIKDMLYKSALLDDDNVPLNLDNIDSFSLENVMTYVKEYVQYQDIFKPFKLLCSMHVYFMKIMYDMQHDIIFDNDDLEYAFMIGNVVAINIIKNYVPITDKAIQYMCIRAQCDVTCHVMKELYDNKFVPKFEHIKYVNVNAIESLELLKLMMNYDFVINDEHVMYLCYIFYYRQTDDLINSLFKRLDDDKLYELHNIMNYTKKTRMYHCYKYDKNTKQFEMKDDVLFFLFCDVIPKKNIISHHLYNNINIDKSIYDHAVRCNDIDVVEYCEKHHGFRPNENTMMLITDPYIRKDYAKRLYNL